jgi:hypothetical protein
MRMLEPGGKALAMPASPVPEPPLKPQGECGCEASCDGCETQKPEKDAPPLPPPERVTPAQATA